MRLFVGVALYKSLTRARSIVDSLMKQTRFEDVFQFFINTGDQDIDLEKQPLRLPNALSVHIPLGHVPYAGVMKAKLATLLSYFGEPEDDDLYYNSDDDYIFNRYLYETIFRLYAENPDLGLSTYINLPVNVEEDNCEVRSGITFLRTGSTMGGSFCMPAKAFVQRAKEYLSKRRIDPFFDQGFWDHLRICGYPKRMIAMPKYFSLVQHINYTSNYLYMKSGPDEHASGANFIETDPFKWGVE